MSLADGSNNKATRKRRLHKGAFWMPGASGLGAARVASSKARKIEAVVPDETGEAVSLDLVVLDTKLSFSTPVTPAGTLLPPKASGQAPQSLSRAA